MVFSEEQVFKANPGVGASTEVSLAIDEADFMSEKSGSPITVVRTLGDELKLFSEFQLTVAKGSIKEQIYNTNVGFVFN